MSDAALIAHQVRYEQRQFWRNPPSAFFAFAFPVIFLVMLSSIYRSNRVAELGNIDENQYFVPAIMAFGVFGATFTNLAISLSIRRDSGVLKRLRATPLPPWVYIAGVVGSAMITASVLAVLMTALGVVAFGVHVPGRWLGLVIDVVVGAACFSAAGIAWAGLIPNGEAATPMTQLVVLPLAFFSGNYGYIAEGNVMSRIASWFPLKHFNRTVFAAFDPGGPGIGVDVRDLLIVAAWGAGSVLLALRVFRWVPRS